MKILHIDDHILIVDKPAGISVLPDGWDPDSPYLLKMLEAEHGRLWVIHRLDKLTSGVLLFARSAEAHRHLSIQFERREVEKIYHAILAGSPPWDNKTTRFPLRANVGSRHRTVVDDRKGKPSETHFIVLERAHGHALVAARPFTGRTHQIRVHAYALGFPVLGDPLYGLLETDLIARPALHALSLGFRHPADDSPVQFSASYPEDFAAALDSLHLTHLDRI